MIKRQIAAVCAAIFASSLCIEVSAQTQRDKFEVAFEAQETRRRAIVAQGLELTEEEAEKFWPLYDAYRNDVKGVELRLVQNLSSFANNFETLDDEIAEELMGSAVDIEADMARLNRDHFKRVRRVLEPVHALRYFQLDQYIDTAQRMSVQRQIPLAGTDLEALYMRQQAAQQR
ncbi:MAG: hypothetical protein AAGI89_14865 [Pseudomonadota bacterium]